MGAPCQPVALVNHPQAIGIHPRKGEGQGRGEGRRTATPTTTTTPMHRTPPRPTPLGACAFGRGVAYPSRDM